MMTPEAPAGPPVPAEAVARWTSEWLADMHGVDLAISDDLLGAIDSLALAELIVACEARFRTEFGDDFLLEDLATIGTLASYVASKAGATSGRTWFHSAHSPYVDREWTRRTGRRLGPAAVVARLTADSVALGITDAQDTWRAEAPPLSDDQPMSTSAGSVLAVGAAAAAIERFAGRLHSAVGALGAIPVWYPLATNSPVGADHPQSVSAGLVDGRLAHAACLQLLAQLPAAGDAIYAGLGYAFRHEPARRFRPQSRLEAYRVYEVVVTGTTGFRERTWSELRELIDSELSGIAEGAWAAARDGFTPGMSRKLEWQYASQGDLVPLASLNDHGTAFAGPMGAGSFCLGVGVDRVASMGLLT